jgi:hypothetical protein
MKMRVHRVISFAVVCITVPGSGAFVRAGEPAMVELERRFRELPMEARRLTGPLFWLHGDESPERLKFYIGKVAEGGNGTFTAESRPHRDWLGEGWYRDLAVCLAAARQNNLTMWIFDEKWWPSQEVGGNVPPRYGSKRLAASAIDVERPDPVAVAGRGGPNFVALIAGRTTDRGIDPRSLVDLSPSLRDGTLTWAAPPGRWKVMTFTWEPAGGKRILVDGASRDCVDWYLQTVYQPHYDRFKDDFGKAIAGFFYDEPETHGDWGTEVRPVLEEKGVDWKQAYVAWKFELAGEAQTAARYAYLDALSEAWGRTLYGGIARWCRDRRIASIGHFLEHDHEYLHLDKCAGNMVQLQKFSDMGAIDAVFKQFVPGKKDDSTYQTPKLGSSISHAYGKADDLAMVEIFGARGQDLTYPEMKWWTDLMQVAGINFLIPHSFNPRAPYDTDCPPYFYNGGYEPRWPLYRVFADYTTRLSLMLSGGRHVCPVAFLFLGHSQHVGKAVTPENMTTAFQDALFDCDWLPYEVFETEAKVAGKELRLREERYKVLVVPPVEVIPYATLQKVKQFFDGGGIVIGYGLLPTKSATLDRTGADIAALREAIWGDAAGPGGVLVRKTSPAGGRSYFLPEQSPVGHLQHVLTIDAGIHPDLEVIEGDTNHWLHVLHRAKAGRDVFLICNQNTEGKARPFKFRVKADGAPECWDPMRNEITRLPYAAKGEYKEILLTLEPLESVLLVFQEESRPIRHRFATDEPPSGQSIAVVRDPTAAGTAGAALVHEPPVPTSEAGPTLSPVRADPFVGRVDVPGDLDLARSRAVLEMDELTPEAAARVTVNGTYAGGFIGRPFRLDVTRLLRAGSNEIRIEPFAPRSARLAINARRRSDPEERGRR